MARLAFKRFQGAAASAWSAAAGTARRADWGAIVLELLLIIAGILIAFQLDRVAEGWKRGRDRQLYLDRLAAESMINIDRLRLTLTMLEDDTGQLRRLLAALPDPSARLSLPAGTGCTILRLPGVRLQTATMQEYADIGSLDLAPDPELRRLVNIAATSDNYAQSQLDYFRDAFIVYFEKLLPVTRQQFDQATGKVRCHMDLEAIAADSRTRSLLAGMYTDRVNFMTFRQRQLDDHRALYRRVCKLARSCPRPPAR